MTGSTRFWCLAVCVVLEGVGLSACGDDTTDDGDNERGGGRSREGRGSSIEEGEPNQLRRESIELPGEHPYATDFAFLPDSSELLLLQKSGHVTHYVLEDDALRRLGAFRLRGLHDDLDCGLLSVAFDPDFEDNGFVYFSLCTSRLESGIFRYHFDANDYDAIDDTRVPIFLAEEPDAERPWHNVGAMVFDDEGNLWIGVGDKTVDDNAGDPDSVLGSIIRIVPNREPDGEGHEPAPDNPFIDAGGHPDVYAYGVRSPWRVALDARGHLWFGDVGHHDFEEVNVISRPGQNFGWPYAQGPCERDCRGLRESFAHWPHDDDHPYIYNEPDANATTGRVAWVGPAYQPRQRDRYDDLLTDSVLFGDSCLGFVRVGELSEDDEPVRDQRLGYMGEGTMAMRQGVDDYLYGLEMGNCVTDGEEPPIASMYRMLPAQR